MDWQMDLKRSVPNGLDSPWDNKLRRSSPIPVSIFLLGSGFNFPSAERSNCVKTWFQISRYRSQSHAGPHVGLPQLHSAPRSQRISEQGPQGPVGPIVQKLVSSSNL